MGVSGELEHENENIRVVVLFAIARCVMMVRVAIPHCCCCYRHCWCNVVFIVAVFGWCCCCCCWFWQTHIHKISNIIRYMCFWANSFNITTSWLDSVTACSQQRYLGHIYRTQWERKMSSIRTQTHACVCVCVWLYNFHKTLLRYPKQRVEKKKIKLPYYKM